MRKPDDLRTWLLRSVPGLAAAPERLHLFIEEGHLRTQRGATTSYVYDYTLIVNVEDFAADSHDLFVPLLVWLAQNEPALIAPDRGDALAVLVDILDRDKADFEVHLPLSETVVVTDRAGGGWQVEYPAPVALPECFADVNARLWQLWLDHDATRDLAAAHPDHLPPA